MPRQGRLNWLEWLSSTIKAVGQGLALPKVCKLCSKGFGQIKNKTMREQLARLREEVCECCSTGWLLFPKIPKDLKKRCPSNQLPVHWCVKFPARCNWLQWKQQKVLAKGATTITEELSWRTVKFLQGETCRNPELMLPVWTFLCQGSVVAPGKHASASSRPFWRSWLHCSQSSRKQPKLFVMKFCAVALVSRMLASWDSDCRSNAFASCSKSRRRWWARLHKANSTWIDDSKGRSGNHCPLFRSEEFASIWAQSTVVTCQAQCTFLFNLVLCFFAFNVQSYFLF